MWVMLMEDNPATFQNAKVCLALSNLFLGNKSTDVGDSRKGRPPKITMIKVLRPVAMETHGCRFLRHEIWLF
jgi:hypothetical protein